MQVGAFLDAMQQEEEDVFCGNFSLRSIHEELEKDVECPVEGAKRDVGNMWIGKAGHVSHLHYDGHPGVLCMVEGTKQVHLWSGGGAGDILMREDARYNVALLNPLLCPDFPPPHASLFLAQGDALLIPLYAFHLVRSVSFSIAVNFWFYPSDAVQRMRLSSPLFAPRAKMELLAIMRLRFAGNKKGEKKESVWELMREDVLREVYAALQHGPVNWDIYPLHKDLVVQTAQEFLQSHRA